MLLLFRRKLANLEVAFLDLADSNILVLSKVQPELLTILDNCQVFDVWGVAAMTERQVVIEAILLGFHVLIIKWCSGVV